VDTEQLTDGDRLSQALGLASSYVAEAADVPWRSARRAETEEAPRTLDPLLQATGSCRSR
jgi:hypothetical protein